MAIDWAPTTELQYRREACLGSAWTHILSLVSATTDTYVVLWEADIATRFVVINSPGPNHKSFLHAVTPEGQKKKTLVMTVNTVKEHNEELFCYTYSSQREMMK